MLRGVYAISVVNKLPSCFRRGRAAAARGGNRRNLLNAKDHP